jgi:hypothetical protein
MTSDIPVERGATSLLGSRPSTLRYALFSIPEFSNLFEGIAWA